MRLYKVGFLFVLSAFITGCAHNINITPEINEINDSKNADHIPAKVGYYFLESREKEVTTPGGGGDKVKYKPYKDIETGFYKMLTNVFDEVHAVKTNQDAEIANKDIDYLIGLKIVTNSASSSAFTWPPTSFSVDLTCKISDTSNNHITDIRAIGQGQAEYSEFKNDFSLTGKRASNDALKKMQEYLLTSTDLQDKTSHFETDKIQESQTKTQQTTSEQLKELKRLFEEGLISNEIYEERQRTILGTF